MKPSLSRRLEKLEQCRHCYGRGCAAEVERLLRSFTGVEAHDVASLIRFHDVLLFFRAFPQSRRVAVLAEKLLSGIDRQMTLLREEGADWEQFDDEQFSGIAGTVVRDTFTYEVAQWLEQQYPEQISVEWNIDEQARPMAIGLPQLMPLIADDSLVEADTPYLDWLDNAAGGEDKILVWLLRRVNNLPVPILQKTSLYDGLRISINWELGDSDATRTRMRRNPAQMYYHREPLIQRKQVSLAEELEAASLPVRKLSRSEGAGLLDQVKAALTVRYRELYGTTRGDPSSVVEADVGRGVHIFLWGLPPERRLPLRAYHAGITFKNGVPINYIEGISLFEWMEVGFNTFYAFRDGETAWIYSKVLHLLHQLTGVTTISVYPYQLGHDNEEAIKSGAFWFYRKLGFRPGRPELLALTEREETKMARNASHRTSASALRKLAAHHVFFEFGNGPRGSWDTFSTRNLGLAVQQSLARRFRGDPEAMRLATTAALAKTLGVNTEKMTALQLSALQNFALILSLVPELQHWSAADKGSLTAIIRAKTAPVETTYLRELQRHASLRKALLHLGSANPAAAA